jgi:hypothetical protein
MRCVIRWSSILRTTSVLSRGSSAHGLAGSAFDKKSATNYDAAEKITKA